MATEITSLSVKIGADLSGFRRGMRDLQTGLQRAESTLSSMGSRLSVGVTAPLAAIAFAAGRSAITFETAMAGVAKTVDAPAEAIADLGRQFTALSEQIPVARTELAGIAEEAGQLGVALEQIPDFTRTVADLRVATNLGEAAGTTLARMANIMGDVTPAFDRMGATIVDLGNNSATTEREIADMALRISGAGKVIGLHHPEVLAFAAALSSVGIESEAGGTAISRVFSEIAVAVGRGGDRLERLAGIAGMTGAEFQQAFQRDAASAVVTFVEGLGRLNDAGVNVFNVLESVEFGEIRVRDALLRAAGAGDLMRRSLERGRQAWQDNNALTDEAAKFYGTSANQLRILRNRLSNVAGELGSALVPALISAVDAADPLIDAMQGMARAFASAPKPVQTLTIAAGALAAALGPVALALGTAASTLSTFAGTAALATTRLAALQGVLSAGGLILSVRSFADAVTLGRWALAGLGALVTPGGIVLAGLGLLAVMLGKSRIEAHRAAQAFEEAQGRISESVQRMTESQARAALVASTQALGATEARLAEVRDQIAAERKRLSESEAAGQFGVNQVTSKRLRALQAEQDQLQGTIALHQRAAEEAARRLDTTMRTRLAAEVPDPLEPLELSEPLDLSRGSLALTADNFARLQKAMADARDRLAELQVERAITPAGPALDRVNQIIDGLRERIALLQGEIARFESEGFGLTPRIDIGNSIKDGLRQIDTAEVSRITKDVARVGESVGSGLVATMREQGVMAGEALMRGLLSGANNLGDIIKSSLINLAVSYVMGPFKAALGIASPSKVFADYGRSLGDGLVEGIESRIAAVQRATSRLTSAASMPTMTPALASVGPMAQAPLFDASKLPRPTDPRQAARDADWLAFLSDSIREWEASGGRMGGR